MGVLLASAVLIYFRGYLIPGTPTLTKQYMPSTILRLFGKDLKQDEITISTSDDQAEQLNNFDIEEYLNQVGATKQCANRDDYCLTEEFSQEWQSEMTSLQECDNLTNLMLERLAVDQQAEIVEHNDTRVLVFEDEHIGKWPSEAALLADTASAAVLADRSDQWSGFDTALRGYVVRSLRLFLDTCPTSNNPVSIAEETVESCCSTHEVIVVSCSKSGEKLFEQPTPK
ncbi:hypothetical protein [Haloarcula sp. K1]|uniref:hypothetical protein n=1 Tax=Haloarcula sp. K1 TaxID=1622207 RepID=UPI0012BA5B10|nr:hypothetical protein [Haloarcula sp. K1]